MLADSVRYSPDVEQVALGGAGTIAQLDDTLVILTKVPHPRLGGGRWGPTP